MTPSSGHRSPTPSLRSARLSLHRPDGGSSATVHDYARRMALLTELDSQTWISRYSAAEWIGDPEAVTSVPRYLAWLRRMHAAWSATPMPSIEQSQSVWPFTTIATSVIDPLTPLGVDLREIARISGSAGSGTARHRSTPRSGNPNTVNQHLDEDVDIAYVAGAAYVAITLASEAIVLSADVQHLAQTSARTPLPQHYLTYCEQAASLRAPFRRELATWADAAGPESAERVVLAARMLTDELVKGLAKGLRPGW